MDYTIMYRFGADGNAQVLAHVADPVKGTTEIWRILERRYLPVYAPYYLKAKIWYHPGMNADMIRKKLGYVPSRLGPGAMAAREEIFALVNNPQVSREDKIVLLTTMDNILVRRENVPEVIDAFRNFEGVGYRMRETSLDLQWRILGRNYTSHPEAVAFGWQHSDADRHWGNWCGKDLETGKDIPYNCLAMDEHKWLFDELQQSCH